MLPDIHYRIRQIRELKGFSQEYVAEKLGISPNGYSKLERGLSKFSYERLDQLAGVFEMDIADLIKFDAQAVVFNSVQKNRISNSNFGYTNDISEADKQRYEERIAHLEEKVRLLEEMNALLKQQQVA